eukprot:3671310-Rhodomonas_salina.2
MRKYPKFPKYPYSPENLPFPPIQQRYLLSNHTSFFSNKNQTKTPSSQLSKQNATSPTHLVAHSLLELLHLRGVLRGVLKRLGVLLARLLLGLLQDLVEPKRHALAHPAVEVEDNRRQPILPVQRAHEPKQLPDLRLRAVVAPDALVLVGFFAAFALHNLVSELFERGRRGVLHAGVGHPDHQLALDLLLVRHRLGPRHKLRTEAARIAVSTLGWGGCQWFGFGFGLLCQQP